VNGGVRHDARDPEPARAEVDREVVLPQHDPTVAVDREPRAMRLVSPLGGRDEVLLAIFHPDEVASGDAREGGDRHFLGIDIRLRAEAASDVRDHNTYLIR
jgi:hypothetical protein